MRYITVATIDSEKFKNAEVFARNKQQAEKKAEAVLRKKYIGDIAIVRTEKKTVWNNMVNEIRKTK